MISILETKIPEYYHFNIILFLPNFKCSSKNNTYFQPIAKILDKHNENCNTVHIMFAFVGKWEHFDLIAIESGIFWDDLKRKTNFWQDERKINRTTLNWIYPLNRMEGQLISLSEAGNIDKVKQILESGKTNINCKDIWKQKSFMIFKFNYFIVFQF